MEKQSLSEAEMLAMRMHGLRDVLDNQIEKPPQGDPYIRAYSLAMRAALDTNGPIGEFMYETLMRRPQFEGSYLINKMRSALQNHLYFPNERASADEPAVHRIILHENGKPLQYPHDFISPEIWTEAFEAVLDDPDVFGEFIIDVWARPLASNVSERYKGIKLFANAALHLGRLDDVTIADIGCSQQAGGNHLVSGVPFERVTVIRHKSPTNSPSMAQTIATNDIMNHPTLIRNFTGIDMFHPHEARPWARACSHYPSELLNPDRVAFYDHIISANPANVHFYRSDFTEFNYDKFVDDQTHEGKPTTFSIVNFTTMLYQATPEERDVMLGHAKKMAEEFIVVQDFASIDPNEPTKLVFRENWQDDPFPYRTLIMDMREDSPRWHEAFRWRDGRCREMVLGLGRVATQNGDHLSIWQPINEIARTATSIKW